ncbi:laminin G domain protein, partial [Ostertagia ostertagi]
ERRSSFCRNEDCNSGICEEDGDTWYCVCPLNATGLRCEVPVQSSVSDIGFKADTSFMAMPSPKSLDHFQVSMDLKPEDVEHNRMLLYVASDYDPESKKHMSVSVSDGSIVYSYSDGEGREEIRTAPIEPGVEYTVVLSRNDSTTHYFINQQMYERKNEMKTFEPGTDLFVGGLPPGLDVPDDVPATSFFGCIN